MVLRVTIRVPGWPVDSYDAVCARDEAAKMLRTIAIDDAVFAETFGRAYVPSEDGDDNLGTRYSTMSMGVVCSDASYDEAVIEDAKVRLVKGLSGLVETVRVTTEVEELTSYESQTQEDVLT